jgi:5-methylcytosine-specific restriction endonuclease McrA
MCCSLRYVVDNNTVGHYTTSQRACCPLSSFFVTLYHSPRTSAMQTAVFNQSVISRTPVLWRPNAISGTFLWYNIDTKVPRAAANSRGNGRYGSIDMNNDTTKRCAKCAADLPRSEFRKDVTQRTDRLARYCKSCMNSYTVHHTYDQVIDKRCPMCATVKPITDFHKDKRSSDNHYTYCKQCVQWMHSQNADKHRAKASAYNRLHPDRVAAHQRTARARRRGAEGTHTDAEWLALCAQYGHRCLCCGKRKPLTRDHVVPLIKGGSNTIDNIQPLCRSCNSRKHDKDIDYRRGDDGV